MESRPAYVTITCKAWDCEVQLRRLDGPAKFRFVARIELLDKDDEGIATDKDAMYSFGCDLLAESIVDSDGVIFKHTETIRWLSGEVEAVGELLPHVIALNGLGPEEEAKKN
jgi:hypothetical protein